MPARIYVLGLENLAPSWSILSAEQALITKFINIWGHWTL